MRRSAFTLIELLVVIAIIQILAAILFPVFAQAKEAAKKSVCVSNCKQIAAATIMYANDYDDKFCFEGSADGAHEDSVVLYEPYVKSEGVFLCPDRADDNGGSPTYPNDKNFWADNKYPGYGYNWGAYGHRGNGMLLQAVAQVGNPGDSNYVEDYFPGINSSQIVNPANMFVFGDSYDTPRITCTIEWSLDGWLGGSYAPTDNPGGGAHMNTSTKSIRHGLRFQYTFADGHAKGLPMQAWWIPGADGAGTDYNQVWLLPPSNDNPWCADPSAPLPVTPDTGPEDSNAPPDNIICSDLINWARQNGTHMSN